MTSFELIPVHRRCCDVMNCVLRSMRPAVLSLLAAVFPAIALSAAGAPAERPNIVFILSDDQGYADVGYRGSEIRTPHLDRLAESGVKLEHFYVQPVCT